MHSQNKKTKTAEENYITICPKCGSNNVTSDLSREMIAWGGSTRWECYDCNYSAQIFPDVKESEIKNFKKNIKEKTENEKKTINESAKTTKSIMNKNANRWVLLLNISPVAAIAVLIMISSVMFVLPLSSAYNPYLKSSIMAVFLIISLLSVVILAIARMMNKRKNKQI